MSAPAAKKRSSTLDEDYLLLEDAVPVKKSRSDVDEQFEDEELDEDALLGLSDNDEPYEGDGGTELDVTLASNEPELDDDGGYSVYPEDKGLEDDSYEVSQEFDEEPGEEFTAEEGTAEEYPDEVYIEETTEEYPEEESYQEVEADDHKTGGADEYKEETSEDVAVETIDESSFFDVLDIDITDDSLIKELEEEEDFAQTSSSGGTFVKPAEPPPIFSTPKTTPKTTPQKLTAPKTPVQVKDTTSKVHPQETEIPKVTTSRAKVGNAEDEDEEEDEERETRGDRFKSERKEMVSLKSGSRNRNIPDTLVLSEAAQKELAEYERQEQEEKQRRMQRRQGWRGGRGGRGGPRGHFQRGRGGFYNNRGRMPLYGPPRFDTRPLFFPRNPMRGFHEPRRFNPVPLIPIVPLQVQPPLITLTNASFTEDDMVDSFGNGRPHRDSPPRQPHQAHPPPEHVMSQPQQQQNRSPDSGSPSKPVIHVNPHFKGQRSQLPGQMSEDNHFSSSNVPSAHSTEQATHQTPPSAIQTVTSIHEPYRGKRGWPEQQQQSHPASSHHLPQQQGQQPSYQRGAPEPPQKSDWSQSRQTAHDKPIYAQSGMGQQHLSSVTHGRPRGSSPPQQQQQQQHFQQPQRDEPRHHQGPPDRTHSPNYRRDQQDFGQRPYDQRHHHESRHAQQQQQQHHRHPEQHHQQHQNTTQRHENFMPPRVVNPPPSEHFRSPDNQHGLETAHRAAPVPDQIQSNQPGQWQRNQGPKQIRPGGDVRMPTPQQQHHQQQQEQEGSRLAPPPQRIIEQSTKHQQDEEKVTAAEEEGGSSEESDPQTKRLRLQIEEQKKLREAIMKRKEERRQQLAAKRQMELKKKLAAKNQSEQPTEEDMNKQQQQQQQGMNKQQQQQQQGMNKQQLHQQNMNQQPNIQKKQILQKQPSHPSMQQGPATGAKFMSQRGKPMQERRVGGWQAVQAVQGTPHGQGYPQQHQEEPSGRPIPSLVGGPSKVPGQNFQATNRRPFHKGSGPQNVANVGRGQPHPGSIQQNHQQRGRGGTNRRLMRGQSRGHMRGTTRGHNRGAMVQQQGHSHQTGNAGPMDHQSIQQQQQHQLQGQQGRVHGTPQGQQHYPPQHQQHNTQQAPHQQRGRGQGSKMSVKQRLGRGAGGGVQQNPQQGFQQQHQRGGMQHKRGGGRGQGNFQGGRNPNVPPNLHHPHPGGGDAPLLNPQSGISIEGLDQQTDGNLVMRMMISVGPVQALKMYPMHGKAIGFFINPNHAINFKQRYNGSVVGFNPVSVKLIGGRSVT